MKKYNYVLMTVLLVCVLLFGGCATRAESATYSICYTKYNNIVQKYVSGDNRIFAVGTVGENENAYLIDLSSQSAYNQVIYQQIQNDDFDEDIDNMNFGLLKQYNEYQSIVEAVTRYFQRYEVQIDQLSLQNLADNGVEIPQSVYANWYNQIDRLESACKLLASKKTKLIYDCKTSIDQISNYNQISDFNNYLKAYQEFIEVVADINKAFQVLHFDYVFNYDVESGDPLPRGQIERWVDSAILYCGIYYYMKDMKNSLKLQNAFAHGITQDEGFVNKFIPNLKDRANLSVPDQTGYTAINTYQVASKKLSAVINDMDKFDLASRKVMEYLKNNNLEQVDESRNDYVQIKSYYQYTQIFEQNILAVQDLINAYLHPQT